MDKIRVIAGSGALPRHGGVAVPAWAL